MKIAIASDHNGVIHKVEIVKHFKNLGIEFIDYSTYNEQLDDYPLFAFKVGESVTKEESDLGILICGSGIGMSIAANKVKGVRAAHVTNVLEAVLAKKHNNANILTMGSQLNIDDVFRIVESFINTQFESEERHVRRIEQINNYKFGEYND